MFQNLFSICIGLTEKLIIDSHLTDSTMEAGLHMVFTLIAGVNKAVLALIVKLHQHTHGAPHGPPERAELQVLVPGQGQKGITAVHQITGHQGIRVRDGGQRVGSGPSNEADNKENLPNTIQKNY